jgi:WXG100 family type VII secretion target
MMSEKTIIDYEQMETIARKFEVEGEELTRLLLKIRQKVHDAQTEWVGRGSDAFYDEMHNKVLPAMQRLCEASFFTAQVTRAILAVYHQAEDEGSSLFKGRLERIGLDGGGIRLGNVGGVSVGPGPRGLGATFGAAGVGTVAGTGAGGVAESGSARSDNIPGAGGVQNASVGNSAMGGEGGGGGGNSGVQGSLGTGGGSGASSNPGFSGSGGSLRTGSTAGMQDHIYGGSNPSSGGDPSRNGGAAGGAGGPQGSGGGSTPPGAKSVAGGVAAVGSAGVAAGGASAALNTAGKSIKGKRRVKKKNKNNE